MEIQETIKTMERIKQHYQDFIIDDYKIDEWHSELCKYDFKEVNEKIDQHMRSEQYGQYIPKIYFLTRNLKTLEQKAEKKEYTVICPHCRAYMDYEKYDKHIERCNSVEFIQQQCDRFELKPIDKEQFRKMPQVQFDEYYNKVLDLIYRKTTDEKELNRIRAIKASGQGKKVQFEINELM